MKRKKAKIILFFYTILKYFLLYLTLFLGVVIQFISKKVTLLMAAKDINDEQKQFTAIFFIRYKINASF